ncbi:MAG: YIP1 family protein [Gemmatimonadota bacterium]|nr:YIP1 family protein [Gemmatimonadota bacterium]MDH3427485.1 YIP1 family protein [Gemmatimonadota bacterium]
MASNTFVGRMIGAAMLDVPTYEAVEHDQTLTVQAGAVIALQAGAAGLATSAAVLGGILSSLLGWFCGAGLIYLIGTRLFGGEATWGEVLRTLGFAASPGILIIFAAFPFLGWFIGIAVGLWWLAAMAVAIRQALDVSTGKAILSGILGFLAYGIIRVALAGVFGG